MKATANKLRTMTCVACGTTVTERMPAGRKYCSLECYRHHGRRPTRRTGAERRCAICDTPVYLNSKRIEITTTFFCGPEHANEWQGRNKTTHSCKTCGNAFRKSPAFSVHGNPTYCSMACRDADPDRRTKLIDMNLKQAIQNEPNSLEKAGYVMLDDIGVRHERQHLIGGKFCVDAFIPEVALVVQFDGDYWHGHPANFPNPDARQIRRMSLDRSQDAYMAACGFEVLRLWESDIKQRPEHVRHLLSQTVARRRNQLCRQPLGIPGAADPALREPIPSV